MKSSTASGSSGATRPKLAAQASSSTSKNASMKAPQPIPTSPQSIKDAETYHHLRALGMPAAITQDDFTRLLSRATLSSASATSSKGAKTLRASVHLESGSQIRAALECLSTHLVGRDEARRLRGCIASARAAHEQAKESRPTSRIRAPAVHAAKGVDVLDDPRAAAAVRRDMAYRNLESVRREHAVEVEKHRALDKQRRDLADQLDERRRVEFLLRILEKRESVRLSRIGMGDDDGGRKGLGALVDHLRKESALATRQWCSVLRESAIPKAPQNPSDESSNRPRAVSVRALSTRGNGLRYKHTTEALAKLHTQHVRRAHRESRRAGEAEHAGIEQAPPTSRGETNSDRIVAVLARLGIRDQEAVEKMKGMLVAVARRRAAARHASVSANAPEIDELRLSAMHEDNEEQRRFVQAKINRIVALGWVCEGYIDLVSTFRAETAPALNAALDGERRRVEGYVDALRASIVQPLLKSDASFVQEVREALGTSRATLPDVVRGLCNQVAVSDKMMRIPSGGAGAGDWPEISVGVERNQRLLERKAAKMEYGFGIAEEVRTVLGDVKRIK